MPTGGSLSAPGELCFVLPIVLREARCFVDGLKLLCNELRRLKHLARAFKDYSEQSSSLLAKQKLTFFSQYIRPLTSGSANALDDNTRLYEGLKGLETSLEDIAAHFEARLQGVRDGAQRGKRRVRKCLDTAKKTLADTGKDSAQTREAAEALRVEYCTYEAGVLTQLNGLVAAAAKTEAYIRSSFLELAARREAALIHFSKVCADMDATTIKDASSYTSTHMQEVVKAAVELVREANKTGNFELKKETGQGVKGLGIKLSTQTTDFLSRMGMMSTQRTKSNSKSVDKDTQEDTIKNKKSKETLNNISDTNNNNNNKFSIESQPRINFNTKTKNLYTDNIELTNVSITLPPAKLYKESNITPISSLVSPWEDVDSLSVFDNQADTYQDEADRVFAGLDVSPEVEMEIPAVFGQEKEKEDQSTTSNTKKTCFNYDEEIVDLDDLWDAEVDVGEVQQYNLNEPGLCNNHNNGNEVNKQPTNKNNNTSTEAPITMKDILKKYGEDNLTDSEESFTL